MSDGPSRDFQAGFVAGIAATKEGFNGECLFDVHSATESEIEEATPFVEGNEEVERLLHEAWARHQKGEPCSGIQKS